MEPARRPASRRLASEAAPLRPAPRPRRSRRGGRRPAPTPPAPQPAASEPPTASAGRNLPVAIASGVALAAAFLGSVFWHPYAFLTFFAVLVGIALLELDVAFRSRELRPATPVVAVAAVVMLYGAYASGAAAQSLALVLVVFGALAWALLDPAARTGALGHQKIVASVGATCLTAVWVPLLASFSALLLLRPRGEWYVAAAVALTVANDVGAYAFGTRWGRHKLAPSVSPGKSWEGFAGGVATAVVIAGLVIARLPGFDSRTALIVAVGVAVAATIGDLAESLVKRDLGVKDLGRIVPGHGGIMDRADGVLFALPTAHLLLLALGI